jgi:SHAQKYF class myb-like DNA-binding protein
MASLAGLFVDVQPPTTTEFSSLTGVMGAVEVVPTSYGTQQGWHLASAAAPQLSVAPPHATVPQQQQRAAGLPSDPYLPAANSRGGRLRWTPALHSRFVAAVHQLGGPQHATPKRILTLMAVPGMNLMHVKSHLQKYRNAVADAAGAPRPGKPARMAAEATTQRDAGPGQQQPPFASQQDATAAQSAQRGGRKGPGLTAVAAMDAELAGSSRLSAAPSLEHAEQTATPQASAGADEPARGDGSDAAAAASTDDGSAAPRESMLRSALRLQLEMQRQLSTTIEAQRKLQQQLEAHGRYIASLLRCGCPWWAAASCRRARRRSWAAGGASQGSPGHIPPIPCCCRRDRTPAACRVHTRTNLAGSVPSCAGMRTPGRVSPPLGTRTPAALRPPRPAPRRPPPRRRPPPTARTAG